MRPKVVRQRPPLKSTSTVEIEAAAAQRRVEANIAALNPITSSELACIARHALDLASTIRDYLPIQGDPRTKADQSTIDFIFREAGEHYLKIEKIRNRRRRSFRRGASSSYVMTGPPRSGTPYKELGIALDDLCVCYGWQGISDGTQFAHSDVRGGSTIPMVAGAILDRIELNAQRLAALNSPDIQTKADSGEQGRKPRMGQRIGRPPLNEVQLNVYQRIAQHHIPGQKLLITTQAVKSDSQLRESITELGWQLNPTLIRKAIACLKQKARRS